MVYYCFYLALFLFVITTFLVIKNRKNFNKSVQVMLIGVVCVITTLITPMYYASYDILTSILFSILYALRALSGCQSVDVSHKVILEGWLYYGYYALLYLAFIAAPIFTTSFLISIFGNLNDKIRYHFLFGKKIHIFSELNDYSITLCESIHDSQSCFVFCNTTLTGKNKGSDLLERARKVGAVILDRSEQNLIIKKKQIFFYQISNDKDRNIDSTLSLIEKYKGQNEKDITIFTLCSGRVAELLFDSLEKGRVIVKLINEVKYTCYSLLDRAPLFESVRDNKVSVLIVGCDYTGMEMLKAILWCGQMDGVELEINIIDLYAQNRKKELQLHCPELFSNEYKINFIQADVKNRDFIQALDQFCRDTSYIIIATGNDILNIDTAILLRKYYLQKDDVCHQNSPQIQVRVRNTEKAKQMDVLCNVKNQSFGLHSFGSIEKTFTIENLIHSSLEKRAVGVHFAYNRVLNETEEQKKLALVSYYQKEYNQRSSLASALHIKYKMFSGGILNLSGLDISEKQILEYERLLADPSFVEKMAKLEHKRWNAFMRTEGYIVSSVDDAVCFAQSEGEKGYINYLAKMHPCLVKWDELDMVGKSLSSALDRDYNFLGYDFDIVRQIPEILRESQG